jgi:hypothetical protein
MKMKQFRSILAVAAVAASITTSLSPAQAIPLSEILDSVGKSILRGVFNLPADRQESTQSPSEQPGQSNSGSTEVIPVSSSEPSSSAGNNLEPSQSDGDIESTPTE